MNENTVDIKYIEFKKQQDFVNSLDQFTKHLAELGYTDRAILMYISPMVFDMIIKNGGKHD